MKKRTKEERNESKEEDEKQNKKKQGQPQVFSHEERVRHFFYIKVHIQCRKIRLFWIKWPFLIYI